MVENKDSFLFNLRSHLFAAVSDLLPVIPYFALGAFVLFIFLLSISVVQAQDRCGFVQFNAELNLKSNVLESTLQFEDWMKGHIRTKELQRKSNRLDVLSEAIYQIPVVFHIIHNGGGIGTGANVSDEKILQQIDSLNNDFRRLNYDKKNTPSAFESVAADVNIQFVLAKRDPEGVSTSGIMRVQGSQSSYGLLDGELLSSLSYWPAEEYLNIWVCPMDGKLLGYAKFPVSNLTGMEGEQNFNREVDGVFINYEFTGTDPTGEFTSTGRTLTHELGHWLGLLHISGNGGCGADDYCNDTPLQSGQSSGCPDTTKNTCTEVSDQNDMFQNYMDYTEDACMNIFTKGQSVRMRTVMENSPRRKSLLLSNGDVAAIKADNDLGIKTILAPGFGNCNLTLIPSIEVRNYGTNEINSFSITLSIDGVAVDTLNKTQTISVLSETSVFFTEVTASANAAKFSFKVVSVNGSTDGNTENDLKSISTYFSQEDSVPYEQDFSNATETPNVDWNIKNNKNNSPAWSYTTAPKLTIENEAVVLSYYGAPTGSYGENDYFISPVFDLTELSVVDLEFDYAYSGYPNNISDGLTVIVSTDCGQTFPYENIIFQKIGSELTTTGPPESSLFIPSGPGDWEEVKKNLNDFKGNSEVVVAFVGSNGGGNNLYLDDILFSTEPLFNYDLAVDKIENLNVVTCKDEFLADIYVRNLGDSTITDFKINYEYGDRKRELEINNKSISVGKTEIIKIESFPIENGDYKLTVRVENPNGKTDENLSNNQMFTYFILDSTTIDIPLRETFDDGISASSWHFIRQDSIHNWQIGDFHNGTQVGSVAHVNAFNLETLGLENWLVSPVLNFEFADSAAMFFDVSYANRKSRNERLRVLLSENCGLSYTHVLYDERGSDLAVKASEENWIPSGSEDWKRVYINLNDFASHGNIRIAFVLTSQNGNNVYLDNIEFFSSDDASPLQIEEKMRVYPNPASSRLDVTFNFEIKEKISLRLIKLNGEVVEERTFENILNQTYRFENLNVENGMYILQLVGETTHLAQRVIIIN